MKSNAKYMYIIILFYMLLFQNLIESFFPLFTLFDEFVALHAIPLWAMELRSNDYKIRISKNNYGLYVLILLTLGIIGNVVFSYQPFFLAALPDAFINTQFWLTIYIGIKISNHFELEKYSEKIFFHVKLITWSFFLLTVMDYTFHLFRASSRYGLRAIQLFYSHPTFFASACILLIIILLMISKDVNGTTKYIVLLSFLAASSLRSKAFGTILALAFILYFVYFERKKISLRAILFLGALTVAVGWERIYWFFFSDIQVDSARYQLLVTSISIANDHFPLGAGFATFASHFSGRYYSPLYAMYGIAHISGLREGATWFISDSFWPMIIGQLGWIGLIVYILLLMIIFNKIQKLRSINITYYGAGLFIWISMLVKSTAESAFVHPYSTGYALCLGYVLGCVYKRRLSLNQRE